jgi:septal ring factor EnvC (AmiA/AmiB activator)
MVCKEPFWRGTVAAVTYLFLFVLIGVGAVLALVAALAALGAYLRYRRARIGLQERLASEVESLSQRTGELERSLKALQERSAQLPISISGLQQNLSTLRVLTGALAASLVQAQRVLSYSVRETVDATPLGRLSPAPSREARRTS